MSDLISSRKKSKKLYIGLNDVLLFVIVQFPISSIIKVYFSPLNLVLTGVCFVLFAAYFIFYGIKKSELPYIAYALISVVMNCFICKFNFVNVNMLFYFPFMIIYFLYFVRKEDFIVGFFKKHKMYVDGVLFIWNVTIAFSFFLPSSYKYEAETRGFVSFAGTTFLLVPTAMFIFALLVMQYQIYKKKIYAISLIIPSLCVLLGTTRTYLVALLCSWLVFVYLNVKNKKSFFILTVAVTVVFAGVVLLSPIRSKFADTLSRTEIGMDSTAAFTSGRSVFWKYDIDHIFSNGKLKIIFGNGINYLFEINARLYHVAIWAHNDYIQILGDYGLIGIGVYLYMFYYLFKNTFAKKNVDIVIIAILLVMWVFVASFNMFYTYFCTMLCFPFYLLVIKMDADDRNDKNVTIVK